MKKPFLFLPLLFGAAGCLLRLVQLRTVFEPSGLARPHPLSALLPLLLAAAAVCFLLPARGREGKQLSFLHSFALPGGQPPFDLVCAALLYLVSGVLLALESVGGADLSPLILAVLMGITGLALLLTLRLWRAGETPGRQLLPPVLFGLVQLLAVYRRFASWPVTAAFYVPVLAQAAIVFAFYQIASYGFGQGRRSVRWSLPMAVILSLTALPDAQNLPQAGMYLASAVTFFTFWRCLGEYTAETDGGGETQRGEEAVQ